VDIVTPWLGFAPIVEIGDMPHADELGVRLLGEASAQLGAGFVVAVRGGYQAREASAGGPGAGVSLAYAF